LAEVVTGVFSIEEHETALRWVSMMRPGQRRVLVRSHFREAEEPLLVLWPDQADPVFAIQYLDTLVLLIDKLGKTMPFLTLVMR